MATRDPPPEVAKILAKLRAFLRRTARNGRTVGSARCGIYAFFDYDGEPIYVGQTCERIETRIGRHLTGRRSDAVAKFVLDPFEVLDIEVWPCFQAEALPRKRDGGYAGSMEEFIDRAEHTIFKRLQKRSKFKAVLNEGVPPATVTVRMPASERGRIIPDDMIKERSHPDIRIARRAQTIASLARNISEREIGKRLRYVLHVQTQRINDLAAKRLKDFADAPEELEGDEELS